MARDVVLVNGLPGSGKSSLGPRLAAGLGATFLRVDTTRPADITDLADRVHKALWT